jgi:hypothetical protein
MEYISAIKYRDERLVWLRNRADGGSLKTRGRPFLWFISFGRAKEMNIESESLLYRYFVPSITSDLIFSFVRLCVTFVSFVVKSFYRGAPDETLRFINNIPASRTQHFFFCE